MLSPHHFTAISIIAIVSHIVRYGENTDHWLETN